MPRLFLLLVSFLALQPGYSQQKKLDSLQLELNSHRKEDSVRFNIMIAITSTYSTVNPGKGLEMADQAIALAKKLEDKKKLALAWKNKAQNFVSLGKDLMALQSYNTSLLLYDQIQYKTGIARVSHNMGMIYSSQGYYTKALEYHQKSARLLGELGDLENLSNALNSIGVNYNYLSDFPRALECYLQSLRIYEKLGDTLGIGFANTLVNIGIVYKNLFNYPKSLEYQEKALRLFKQLGDKQGMANAFGNLGSVYDNLSNSSKALEAYLDALALNQVLGDNHRIAADLTNIGIVYNTRSEYTKAFEYLTKALTLYKQTGDDYNSSLALSEMGKNFCYAPASLLAKKGINPARRYVKAIEYQERALLLARKSGALSSQLTALDYLSKSFELQKNYAEAFSSYKQFVVIRDSIYNADKQNAIVRREMQYEFDKKEALSKAENEKKQALAVAEIKRQRVVRNSAMGGAGILLLAGMSSFIFYKKKRDADGQKKDAEFKSQVSDTEMKALRSQMNPHFIFNSLNSISDYMARHDLKSADNYLTKFAKLMRLILENSEHRQVSLSDDLKALEIYMQLESMRLNHKFTYEINIDDSINKEATLIPPLILQPFVENSIWHGISRKEGLGKILIHIKKEEGMINCMVEDNGIGRGKSVTIKTGTIYEENKSLGMKITRARIDIINQIKKSNAAVELTDLEEGTRVEVRLPLELAF